MMKSALGKPRWARDCIPWKEEMTASVVLQRVELTSLGFRRRNILTDCTVLAFFFVFVLYDMSQKLDLPI
jgi:hypothetical protein